MPTSNEWLAIWFLLYLLVPVVLYLVGALFVVIFRKLFGRKGEPSEGSGDA